LVHPILEIDRDAEGRLVDLRATEVPQPSRAESVMHIQVSSLPAASHAEVEASIRAVLEDVRHAVSDFPQMRGRCLAQAAALRSGTLPDTEAATETAQFLEWLTQGHFVYQGYSYCRFERAPLSMRPIAVGQFPSGGDAASGVRFERDRGLGILRDPVRPM